MASFKCQCPACGQRLEGPLEAAGAAATCPTCQNTFDLPLASENASSFTTPAVLGGNLCAICQSGILPAEPTTSCPACRADYHKDCWDANGGCAIYGCSQSPEVQPRRAIEIPASYWGQENKPCPSCNCQILAAATRCRHCGATFALARPEDSEEFERRQTLKERLPGMKRTVLWIFVFSVVPCLAPIGAVWASIWYAANRQHLRALPAVSLALCRIALAVGIGQCVLVALLSAIYAISN